MRRTLLEPPMSYPNNAPPNAGMANGISQGGGKEEEEEEDGCCCAKRERGAVGGARLRADWGLRGERLWIVRRWKEGWVKDKEGAGRAAENRRMRRKLP
mmetsp:Transcript_58610/g.141370  ORF Transcript_58610/g.141370 Transcript_58610/m.141370 type:complete len:99 (-) Transcript_58610:56-352(-)